MHPDTSSMNAGNPAQRKEPLLTRDPTSFLSGLLTGEGPMEGSPTKWKQNESGQSMVRKGKQSRHHGVKNLEGVGKTRLFGF
jgi:hypothetical protein